MEPIVSGSTIERTIRTAAMAIMFCGFSAYSFYDGYQGYPLKNVKEFVKAQGLPDKPLPPIQPELTSTRAQELVTQTNRRSYAEAKAILGEPSITVAGAGYYFGPGGRLKLTDAAGRAEVTWEDAVKKEIDLTWQFGMGVVTGLIGLPYLVLLLIVLTFRASLTEAGLKVTGHPLIPFDAIEGFEDDQYRKSGVLDLVYTAGGTKKTIKLDSYHIKKFREIILKICEHRGITNPLRAAQEEMPGDNLNAIAEDHKRS